MSPAVATTQAAALQRRLAPPSQRPAGALEVLVESALSQAMEERARSLGIQPRELEQQMLNHITDRNKVLKSELGYMNYTAPGWIAQARQIAQNHSGMGYGLPFMAKRQIAQLIYNGEMDWRAPLHGGIWAKSNIHLPITRRFVQQQIARATRDLVGTEPFFYAAPVPKKDAGMNEQTKALAELLDRWAQFECGEAQLQATLAESISNAFIMGEQVMKPIFEEQIQYYQAFETVAVDNKGPLIAQDGGYIYEQDKFIEAVNPITQQADMVLARDGRTPKPNGTLTFKRMRVQKRLIQYSGARVINVPFTAFLCPLTASSVARADICTHLHSEQLVSLIARYAALDAGPGLSPAQMRERTARMVYEFSGRAANNADFTPDKMPRADLSESTSMLGTDNTEPSITKAESFFWYDALQDGTPSYITAILDDETGKPLYYDWAANPLAWNKGLPPFEVARINPVEDRWHGRGQVDLFYKLQHNIDLFINRWNHSQSKSGRIDVVQRDAFLELEKDPNIPINGGTTLSMKQGYTKEDALFSYYLNEVKGADLNSIMQVLLQIGTNLSGVANGNDANTAGLDTSQTATGINNIASSGDELSSTWTRQLRGPIERLIRGFIALSATTLRTPRAFSYFQGDVQTLAEITPEQVNNLETLISLTMTQTKARTTHENKTAAYEIVKNFYNELNPVVQNLMAPFVRQWLKDTFQVEDADEIIQPITPPAPTLPDGTPAPTASPDATQPTDPNAAPAPEEIPL